MNVQAQPWERQKGESAKSFEAFATFRDLGPERTISEVSKRLQKSGSLLYRWSNAWDWDERARAWDNEQDRKAQKEHIQEIAKMRSRHTKLAESMLLKAAKALKDLPDGAMKPADITRMVDVAAQLERLSRGDTTDSIEIKDGGKTEPAVKFYMPDNGRDEKDADNIQVGAEENA